MENKVYKVKELRVDKYLSSFKLGNLCHCKLQFFVEEISMLGKLNVFTIGTGECSFYALKTKLEAPAINVSYSLSNSEIIFGDLSKVEDEIRKLANEEYKTVVLMTCIPSIMNLDLKEFIQEFNGKILLFLIPEFSGYSALDYLPNLYVDLFKDYKANELKDDTTTWENEFYSYEEIEEKLTYKNHIIINNKFSKMISELANKNNYNIIDKSNFDYDEFIKFINEDDSMRNDFSKFLKVLKEKDEFIILSNFYTEFVSIFKKNDINFSKIILNTISKRRYEILKSIDENILVEFSSSDKYSSLEPSKIFNTLDVDYDFFGIDIYQAIIKIIRRILYGNL